MSSDLTLELQEALAGPTYGQRQSQKEAMLTPILEALTAYHQQRCVGYDRIVRAVFPGRSEAAGLVDLPYVPVGIFKHQLLSSVPREDIFKILTSSGTTGAQVSRVPLDRETAKRQTIALNKVMTELLGKARRPMLIIDAPKSVGSRSQISARGAGIVGLMGFGRRHTFLLDDEMGADVDVLRNFLEQHAGDNLLIFGFTFMVWQHLVAELGQSDHFDLSRATLLHSGGWKKLEDQRVDNATFKRRLHETFGIEHVFNFYGMAEQVGSVFIEGQDDLLHATTFSDVMIRHPSTWEEQPCGEPGLIQVVSAVPTSYPGHSILTEDLGVVETIDSGLTPHGGKAFRVLGRVERAELRGCSDTYASSFVA